MLLSKNVKHLISSLDKGLKLEPDFSKGLEVRVDANFVEGFDKSNAEDHISVCSRTGHIIKHAGCSII